jgi:hypothetical protein
VKCVYRIGIEHLAYKKDWTRDIAFSGEAFFAIGLSLVQKILRWRHTGFNIHSQVRATSKREAERVGKYIPFTSPL